MCIQAWNITPASLRTLVCVCVQCRKIVLSPFKAADQYVRACVGGLPTRSRCDGWGLLLPSLTYTSTFQRPRVAELAKKRRGSAAADVTDTHLLWTALHMKGKDRYTYRGKKVVLLQGRGLRSRSFCCLFCLYRGALLVVARRLGYVVHKSQLSPPSSFETMQSSPETG